MTLVEERFLIYAALLLVCAVAGSLLGLAAAIWSFLQMAVVIELMYMLGLSGRNKRV
ncbi:MAG: hypothetical protein V7746_16785 [Halioglobus sp.]